MNRVAFLRQMRLPEIGEAGQERLLASTVAPGATGELARAVEVRYLERAGVTVREAREGGAAPPAIDDALAALGLRHAAARDVGEGALRALAAMRAILSLEENEP
jgi:hypothetical protein